MTWHFTHDKKETIMALLHDVGTPCFAHCIDYVLGDYLHQESSEKNVVAVIKEDKKMQIYLREDGLCIEDFSDASKFPILENKSPKLCTDRLDGVLHTFYIWLHTYSLEQIKEVYDNLTILENEEKNPEIGFKDMEIAEKFVAMVYNYAKELQGNKDKYVMKYIAEIVKLALDRKWVTLKDLYTEKEETLCNIFHKNFPSWEKFKKATVLVKTDCLPKNRFYVSFETKKRNTIPLVLTSTGSKRIVLVSHFAKEQYDNLKQYKDTKYAYIKEIDNLEG